MAILSGITKEIFSTFSGYQHSNTTMAFVRASKDTTKGGIWMGDRQYAVADFKTTDDNMLLDFTDTGGLDVNYNLKYDYEFTAGTTDNGDFQKVLKLPNGTYTFFVEQEGNGERSCGYINIAVEYGGLRHEEFSVNKHSIYYTVQNTYQYFLCIQCNDPRAPQQKFKFKLVGSSLAKKKDITIENEYITSYEFSKYGVYEIPCITNNATIININSADVETTYCTTATVQTVESQEVGVAYLLKDKNFIDYIINTNDVDGKDAISGVVVSDEEAKTEAKLDNGVYRFKFTDAVSGAFTVKCSDTAYTYDDSIIRKNAILSLTINGDYSEWTINNPNIYSSDDSIDVTLDGDGGYDVKVNDTQIGEERTNYDYSITGDSTFEKLLSIPLTCPENETFIMNAGGNDLQFANYGTISINSSGRVETYGSFFAEHNVEFHSEVTDSSIDVYVKGMCNNHPVHMKMIMAPDSADVLWSWGDNSHLDTTATATFNSNIKSEIAVSATSNPYSNYSGGTYASGDTRDSIPSVQAVIDWSKPFVSGVTLNGTSGTVNDRMVHINTNTIGEAGLIQKNALVEQYFGLHGRMWKECIKLFSTDVMTLNGEKWAIAFRVLSNNCDNICFAGEYYFDSHNVGSPDRRSTFGCIDFSGRQLGVGTAAYGGEILMGNWDDIFYTIEQKTKDVTTEIGGEPYTYTMTYYTLTFYKLCLNDFAMFTVFVDYVYGCQNATTTFYSLSYRSCGVASQDDKVPLLQNANESIKGEIFDIDRDEDTYYTPVLGTKMYLHAAAVPELIDDVKASISATSWPTLYYPSDFREGQSGSSSAMSGYISSITINNSSEGVSVTDKVADLTIKDWTNEINFLSGRVSAVVDSLDINGEEGGSGAKIVPGATAVTYSDGTTTYTKVVDDNRNIDLGNIMNASYIDETGKWLCVYSKKTSAYQKIDISSL